MARKNLLEGLADQPDNSGVAAAYPMRGAGKSLVRSLDELAKQADKFLDGEVVVELDPQHLDVSFVKDRLAEEDDDFRELLEAIRSRGQDTPILVRPSPKANGRYQIVFGHRRVRAARELGRSVRAIVKSIDDRTHVIAQGQENSARSNLTFIERALFATGLEELGYDREVITTALGANAASVSKMLSVTERIPRDVIKLIGSAPSVGRERWVELSLLAGKTSNSGKLSEALRSESLQASSSDERFTTIYGILNQTARPVRKVAGTRRILKWQPKDNSVVANLSNDGKIFSLSMKAKNASPFGEFLSARLDELYSQFLEQKGYEGD